MDPEDLISRGELEGMLWSITDIAENVKVIRTLLEEEDDGEEEEEDA